MLRFKNTNLKVMDLDEQHRKVQIYVSAFNNKDSDGDIILPGAFKKTIEERGPMGQKLRIKHLRDHWNLVGKPLEMAEDEHGLLVLSQVSNSTAGRDLMEDYKLDLFEHSIGFEIVKSVMAPEDQTQYLKELMLWEYSSVTWGANSETPLVSAKAKGETTMDYLERINNRMEKLNKALRSGNYTDERFEEIVYQLGTIQKAYNEIISSLQKPEGNTELQPSNSTKLQQPDIEEIGKLFDSFKSKILN